MNYQDIEKVNGEIVKIDYKGKNYAMVPERVTAFRKLYPEGFIRTDIVTISDDGSVVIMQARAGYYNEQGQEVVLGTGFAREKESANYINKTSHIENCETSAVGRALGFLSLGIDGGGICSAEELVNAVKGQEKQTPKPATTKVAPAQITPPEKVEKAKVEEADKVPPVEENPVHAYLRTAKTEMAKQRGISEEQNREIFAGQYKALLNAGLVPNKKLSLYTMDEAMNLVNLMFKQSY